MSLPGRWRWRDRPIFRKARLGHCVCNIDPPASPYAIMRRACPYRGENRGPGKDDRGELDNVEWVGTIGASLLGRNPPTLVARVVFRRPLVESECGAVALG